MKGDNKPYEVGHGKPPLHSRIKPGEVRNPGGKSSEEAKALRKAGEIAAKIQLRLLEALEAAVDAGDEAALDAIRTDPLKLIKDAMDRDFGTATTNLNHSGNGPNGEIVFQTVYESKP